MFYNFDNYNVDNRRGETPIFNFDDGDEAFVQVGILEAGAATICQTTI
jgi:hypothetical protein